MEKENLLFDLAKVRNLDQELLLYLYNNLEIEEYYQVYEDIYNKKQFTTSRLDLNYSDIGYLIDNEVVDTKHLLKCIQALIEITSPVYPLGSILTLNHNFFENVSEDIQVMVVQNFGVQDNAYFDYGVCLYPNGINMEQGILYITSRMIKEVNFLGFEDEEYLKELKYQVLIVEKLESQGFTRRTNNGFN